MENCTLVQGDDSAWMADLWEWLAGKGSIGKYTNIYDAASTCLSSSSYCTPSVWLMAGVIGAVAGTTRAFNSWRSSQVYKTMEPKVPHPEAKQILVSIVLRNGMGNRSLIEPCKQNRIQDVESRIR
ncbi:hypothetical protein N7G274_000505 [Stereocaulon virgatum]|uniref:Uncharacterized protein n=1 Tax=Stereocaulon virgatum TaxID=373712 RepID=A0ABR4AYM8_9LECA